MSGAASEVSDFELEHDYAKHPTLRAKPQTEQICKDRVVLLESKKLPSDDELDVDGIPDAPPLTYNKGKIHFQINELRKQVNQKVFGSESEELTVAEENFWENLEEMKKDLKPKKLELLDRTMALILDLYTVFLSIKDQDNEALKRRSAIDRCARHMRSSVHNFEVFRILWSYEGLNSQIKKYSSNIEPMRRLFASVGYQNPNLQWLHQTMVDMLPRYLCGPYLDVLCSLRSKVPHLMNGSLEPILSQGDTRAARALGFTTRKPWDPLTASPMNILKQKLSHSNIPFVLCVPNRPPQPKNAPQLRRMRFWNTQLGSFGKIVGVNMTSLINSETTHQEYIDQMVKSTRANVLDLHKRHPNKPIVLVGWDNAALISLYVALLEPQNVTAVCCLGLPLKSLKGWRGEDIDPLTSLKCPVFIAAGSESLNSDPDEIDELRDQFEVQSALVVVQGGDSLLRVPTKIQHEHGITQAMADKMVIDEMWEFLNSQITQKYAKIENTSVPVLGAPSTPKSTIIIDPIKPQSSKKPVGRPPKSKAEENTVKEYTLFLKKKIKILGRMPSTDENKKFFAEFNRLKNKDKKRKTEETDKEWTLPSEKKAKNDKNRKISSQGLIAVPVTMNQRTQKESENIESQNAALNLERLLESN